MSLLTYIGVALLSWFPLVAVVLVVGGIAAFLVALTAPSSEPARATENRAPVRRTAPRRSERAAVVDLRDRPATAVTVPGQRRPVRSHQDA